MKRILKELRTILRSPHPAVTVFPSENALFWRCVIEGPADTVYAGGSWLAYIKFGRDFPAAPPTFKFVTPIRHCNINGHGRICHSILDRNWTADTGLLRVFECVYGLLLSPDTADPLDSTLALSFYEGDGRYEAEIIAHTKLHAMQWTRKQRVALLEASSEDWPTRVARAHSEKAAGNRLLTDKDFSGAVSAWTTGVAVLASADD